MKKLILNFNQFDLNVSFDLVFVDQTLFKATILKTEHFEFKNESSFFEVDKSDIKSLIEKAVVENAFEKAPLILSINSNHLFIETIDIPRLTAQEEKKAIQIEMDRLYADYNHRFAFVQKSYLVTKKLKRIKVAAYDRSHYIKLLQFVRSLKHPLLKVVLTPYSIMNGIITNKLCDLSKPFIFINVSTLTTNILVYRKTLDSYHLVYEGIRKQQEEEDSNDYYLVKRDILLKLSDAVKRVMYQMKNTDIDHIYLNIENDDNVSSLDLLSNYLGQDILDIENKKEVLSYLSYFGSIKSKASDYSFPLRMQVIKKR